MDKRIELYEITGAYADAASALMECETDEEYAAALDALNAIEGDLMEAGRIKARVLRNIQLRAAMHKTAEEQFKAEGKRHEQKRKAAENAAERLKSDVLFAMDTAGLERIRTDIGTWYIGKSIACNVTDPDKVPAEYIKRYTPEVDKAAAKDHYTSTGELIDGLEFIHGRTARFR